MKIRNVNPKIQGLKKDDDFNRYAAQVIFYHDIFSNLVLGLRDDGNMVGGTPPFYAYPFIQRGIKAMRYQGEEILQGEAELRWEFTSRWSLIGFGGVGTTFVSDDFSEYEGAGNGETVTAQGLGFRYFLAKRYRAWRGRGRGLERGGNGVLPDVRKCLDELIVKKTALNRTKLKEGYDEGQPSEIFSLLRSCGRACNRLTRERGNDQNR